MSKFILINKNKKKLISNDIECSICLEKISEERNPLIQSFSCSHIFHKNCIDQYFKRSGANINTTLIVNSNNAIGRSLNQEVLRKQIMNNPNSYMNYSNANLKSLKLRRMILTEEAHLSNLTRYACPVCRISLNSNLNKWYKINKYINSSYFFIWNMILLKISGGDAIIDINFNGTKYDSPEFLIGHYQHFFNLSILDGIILLSSKLKDKNILNKIKKGNFPNQKEFLKYLKIIVKISDSLNGESSSKILKKLPNSNIELNINFNQDNLDIEEYLNEQNIEKYLKKKNFFLWKLVILKISNGGPIDSYFNIEKNIEIENLPDFIDESFFSLSSEDALNLFKLTEYFKNFMINKQGKIPDFEQFKLLLDNNNKPLSKTNQKNNNL